LKARLTGHMQPGACRRALLMRRLAVSNPPWHLWRTWSWHTWSGVACCCYRGGAQMPLSPARTQIREHFNIQCPLPRKNYGACLSYGES